MRIPVTQEALVRSAVARIMATPQNSPWAPAAGLRLMVAMPVSVFRYSCNS